MKATQSYPNLLSEKQGAARLGVARITLLRAREAGRIRFFRIGTRVLYCEEQLAEFLKVCERNGDKEENGEGPDAEAKRKDNSLSHSRRSVLASQREAVHSDAHATKADQAVLPFAATR